MIETQITDILSKYLNFQPNVSLKVEHEGIFFYKISELLCKQISGMQMFVKNHNGFETVSYALKCL